MEMLNTCRFNIPLKNIIRCIATCSRSSNFFVTYLQLLTERTAEVEQRKAEWSTQNTTLSSKYAREVEAERERAIQTQSEAEKKFEAEKQSLIGNYEAKVILKLLSFAKLCAVC